MKGGKEGDTIPFDSPLYTFTADETIEYRNCEALASVFLTTRETEGILPEGLDFHTDPPQGAVWLSNYGDSTLGPYYEWISMLMVKDEEGDWGYYIPYIYVTNDAALAAGREVAGAPKKLAHIKIDKEYEIIQGTLERPAGKRLATLTFQPQSRGVGEIIDYYMPKKINLYSVRYLPPLKRTEKGIAQLIKWYSIIDYHKDPKGIRTVWIGPLSITYDSPSVADPIHKIKIEETLASLYFQFDMTLGFTKLLKEY